MVAEVRVTGLREVQRLMRQLPKSMNRTAIRQSTQLGANVVLKEARRLVPVKSGTLRKSLRSQTLRSPSGLIRIRLGHTSGRGARYDGWYGHLIEFGSSAHQIVAGERKILQDEDDVFGKVVNHPGNSPQPYMRPAVDTKGPEAVRRISDDIQSRLRAAIRKYRKGPSR